MTLAGSFMISADNAHALHPNYIEKADPVNRPLPNGGIVIKYNANQKYTTDAVSAAVFKLLCERVKRTVPDLCQPFRYGRRLHSWKYCQHQGFLKYGGYRSAAAGDAFSL